VAQAAAHLQTIHLGQHQVQDHEVEHLLVEAVEGLATVGRLHYVIALLAQRI